MSLRAKIESVVYAAEEPVTLPQLAAVFGDEVRELLAEKAQAPGPRDEAVAADGDAPEAIGGPDAPEVIPGLDAPEATGELDMALAEVAAAVSEPASDGDGAATLPGDTDATMPAEAVAEAAPPGAEASEAEAKRAVRQQERAIRDYLRQELDGLMAELAAADRGVEIREIAGGYRMATKPEYHDAIRAFVKSLKPPMKLSLQALETLAVVAYKQPVTAPEITEIRGVESGGVLGSLLSRKLIATAGRKQVIGRPILYKTTKEFLLRFGLKDLNELPSMEEFEKMAGELAEAERVEEQGSEVRHQGFAGEESGTRDPESEEQRSEQGAEMETEADEPFDQTTGHPLAAEVPATENAALIDEAAEIVVGEAPTGAENDGQPPADDTADTRAPEAE